MAEWVRREADRHAPTGVSRPHDRIWEAHLRRILEKYVAYYNRSRIHRALNKDAPFSRAVEHLGVITSRPVLGGLHHQYCRIRFSVHPGELKRYLVFTAPGFSLSTLDLTRVFSLKSSVHCRESRARTPGCASPAHARGLLAWQREREEPHSFAPALRERTFSSFPRS